MNDLISRQAAIDALFELYEHQRDIDPTEAADLVRQGIYLAEKKIEQLPPVQPKHGKWIDMPYTPSHTKYMCSECGKTIYTNSDYIKEHKFCFSCGADMRCSENPNS